MQPSRAGIEKRDLRHASKVSAMNKTQSPAKSITAEESRAPYAVDFEDVSTVGLESSPVASSLAGLRAHEARYFKNKYDHVFTVEPARDAKATIDWVHRILAQERDIV